MRIKQEEHAKKLLFKFSVNQLQNQLTAVIFVTVVIAVSVTVKYGLKCGIKYTHQRTE